MQKASPSAVHSRNSFNMGRWKGAGPGHGPRHTYFSKEQGRGTGGGESWRQKERWGRDKAGAVARTMDRRVRDRNATGPRMEVGWASTEFTYPGAPEDRRRDTGNTEERKPCLADLHNLKTPLLPQRGPHESLEWGSLVGSHIFTPTCACFPTTNKRGII